MTDQDEKTKAESDPAPEVKVVPVEDLDKIEKLLDVFMNTKDMPNLSAIKQSCMDELVQINLTLEEAQMEAQVEYQKAMAEWSAKREAERKAKEKERLAAEKKAKEADPQPDSWTPPRDSLAQPVDRRI